MNLLKEMSKKVMHNMGNCLLYDKFKLLNYKIDFIQMDKYELKY